MAKKLLICLTSIFIIVTCTSCKTDTPYLIQDYLNYIIEVTGIGQKDNFDELINWKIINDKDLNNLNNKVTYDFIDYTVSNLLEEKLEPLKIFSIYNLINKRINLNDYANKIDCEHIIDEVVKLINNKKFNHKYEYNFVSDIKNKNDNLNIDDIVLISDEYKKVVSVTDNDYLYEDAKFEDVYSYLDIEDSFVVDFNDAIITPISDEISNISYSNNIYNLLASRSNSYSCKGFNITYSLNGSGIDFHISKNINKINVYADASIRNVKPNFKWLYKDGDIKNCYFNVTFDTTTSLGASIGKYGDFYLKLKDLDETSFLNSLKSMITPSSDEIEAIIPICEIKTPIPNIPLVYINMTVGIKIYASGKIELVLYNNHNIGFEIKDGHSRFFYEHQDDIDTIARASSKASLAFNIGIDATKFRLCDLELDAGIKTEVKSTIHLYDSDFNQTSMQSDIQYSTLQEVSKDNSHVFVCGDVSLYWLLDLICNTSKSILYKYGFTKTFHILDEDNQVFNNLHHIENGQFVKKCTRTSSSLVNHYTLDNNAYNKIVLNTYAEVLLQNSNFEIVIEGLPQSYTDDDIRYSSDDNKIASVNNGVITAFQVGACKIRVYTSDGKYNSYINILVSTG